MHDCDGMCSHDIPHHAPNTSNYAHGIASLFHGVSMILYVLILSWVFISSHAYPPCVCWFFFYIFWWQLWAMCIPAARIPVLHCSYSYVI